MKGYKNQRPECNQGSEICSSKNGPFAGAVFHVAAARLLSKLSFKDEQKLWIVIADPDKQYAHREEYRNLWPGGKLSVLLRKHDKQSLNIYPRQKFSEYLQFSGQGEHHSIFFRWADDLSGSLPSKRNSCYLPLHSHLALLPTHF